MCYRPAEIQASQKQFGDLLPSGGGVPLQVKMHVVITFPEGTAEEEAWTAEAF